MLITRILRMNIADFATVSMGPSMVSLFEAVRNLGICSDPEHSFRKYTIRVVKNCRFHLRNMISLRNTFET